MQNFRAVRAPPQTPVPPAAGGFAPKPSASGGWGLRPQTSQIAPHCEFLATRLLLSVLSINNFNFKKSTAERHFVRVTIFAWKIFIPLYAN